MWTVTVNYRDPIGTVTTFSRPNRRVWNRSGPAASADLYCVLAPNFLSEWGDSTRKLSRALSGRVALEVADLPEA